MTTQESRWRRRNLAAQAIPSQPPVTQTPSQTVLGPSPPGLRRVGNRLQHHLTASGVTHRPLPG